MSVCTHTPIDEVSRIAPRSLMLRKTQPPDTSDVPTRWPRFLPGKLPLLIPTLLPLHCQFGIRAPDMQLIDRLISRPRLIGHEPPMLGLMHARVMPRAAQQLVLPEAHPAARQVD